jgi:hypothetical protein
MLRGLRQTCHALGFLNARPRFAPTRVGEPSFGALLPTGGSAPMTLGEGFFLRAERRSIGDAIVSESALAGLSELAEYPVQQSAFLDYVIHSGSYIHCDNTQGTHSSIVTFKNIVTLWILVVYITQLEHYGFSLYI